MMSRGISIGFLALALTAATTTAYASTDVVSMDATFITKANPKAQYTNFQGNNLTIKVYDSNNNLVAERDGVQANWGPNTVNTTALDMKKSITQSDVSGCKVKLSVKPDGSGTWKFNYNIVVTYSDASIARTRWDNKSLSKSQPTTSDSFNK